MGLRSVSSRPGSDSIYVLSLAWRKLSLALAKSDFLKWSSMCPDSVVVFLTKSPHTQSTPQNGVWVLINTPNPNLQADHIRKKLTLALFYY
jgi:hypothetical protein